MNRQALNAAISKLVKLSRTDAVELLAKFGARRTTELADRDVESVLLECERLLTVKRSRHD